MDTPCVIWPGRLNPHGYGRWGSRLAHRLAYVEKYGPVPTGLELDHLCRVRACVNPDHLEPVTHAENCLRGDSGPARNARKTECINGHPFDAANTGPRRLKTRTQVGRRCLTCHHDRGRQYRAAGRAR